MYRLTTAHDPHYTYGSGNIVRAAQLYDAALALDPSHLGALHNVAATQQHQGLFRESVTPLTRLLQHDPAHARGHTMLGQALEVTGAFDDALAAYARAIHAHPDGAVAHQRAGVLQQLFGASVRGASGQPVPPAEQCVCTAQALLLRELSMYRESQRPFALSERRGDAREWMVGKCTAQAVVLIDVWEAVVNATRKYADSTGQARSKWYHGAAPSCRRGYFCSARPEAPLASLAWFDVVDGASRLCVAETARAAGNASASMVAPDHIGDSDAASRHFSDAPPAAATQNGTRGQSRRPEFSAVVSVLSRASSATFHHAQARPDPDDHRLDWHPNQQLGWWASTIVAPIAQDTAVSFVVELANAFVSGVEPVVYTDCAVLRTSAGCWLPLEVDGRPFATAATRTVHLSALAVAVGLHTHSYTRWITDGLMRVMYVHCRNRVHGWAWLLIVVPLFIVSQLLSSCAPNYARHPLVGARCPHSPAFRRRIAARVVPHATVESNIPHVDA